MPRISLPNEHGGYLTVAGATVAGALVSPSPGHALAAGLAVASGFFARGPLDRVFAQKDLRDLDRPWLGALAALGASSLTIVATKQPWLAAILAGAVLALTLGSESVRTLRRLQDGTVELAGMSALAGSAALMALAGGVPWVLAAALGSVFMGHVAASVPLVRSEILPAERPHAGRAEWKALGLLILASVACAALGKPGASLCLVPRLFQVALRRLRGRKPRKPQMIGVEETVALACVVVLSVVTLGG